MRVHWSSWCAIAMLSLLLGACDKSTPEQNEKPVTDAATEAEAISPSWEAHIADYPKRWIATEAPMYIRFTHPVISEAEVNTAFNPKQVTLDTKTPLNLTFISTTELRISPIERLPNDTEIRIRLSADDLEGIEQSLDDFEFKVRTIKQDFDLRVNSLSADEDDEELMRLSGVITTADTVALDEVKKFCAFRLMANQRPM